MFIGGEFEFPGLDSDVLFTISNGTRVYTTGRVTHKDGFDWYEVHLRIHRDSFLLMCCRLSVVLRDATINGSRKIYP